MGAFAAVAQGSAHEPQLITSRYEPAGAAAPLLGLVGKAVTFDSGGYSIKPAARMHEMKFDMCGGAAVLEATARDRGARPARRLRRPLSARRRTWSPARARAARATSSAREPASRSRSTTPTPRAGSCSPTA